jgi:hypothetical protein
MKKAAIALSSMGLLALLLAVDGGTTRIFIDPRGFEAGASVAVLFWLGLAVTLIGVVCGAVHVFVQKLTPWKSGAFIWCSLVIAAYALIWLFPPGNL